MPRQPRQELTTTHADTDQSQTQHPCNGIVEACSLPRRTIACHALDPVLPVAS
jgi:hypothetical protein